jgi:hypothetical protein
MQTVAEIVTRLYGGSIRQENTFRYQLQDTRLGDFALELDATLLKDKKYVDILDQLGIQTDAIKKDHKLEEKLKKLASGLVPYEIVTPPIPLSELDALTKLTQELRQYEAQGTKDSLLHAFGLHLNPEAASLETGDILNILRAFMLLEPWIRVDADIDISRRLTPYIEPFEQGYIRHVLNPNYEPDQVDFIRDYLNHDNTRNRSLDLLPLFMHLRKPLVLDHLDDDLLSARPAYHYRLPNCALSDPEWSIADEWNRWVLVETLAHNPHDLRRLSRAYLDMQHQSFKVDTDRWISFIDQWVRNVE